MEEPVKDQQLSPLAANIGKSKLQRYALRLANKSKGEKSLVADLSSLSSSVSKREISASNGSKSIGFLDLSWKDMSAKPPRRLSIPAKSNVGSVLKPVCSITPIFEAKARSSSRHGKSETPVSAVSRSSRTRFHILSSTSYWLSHINLAEGASKHSVSLGFFKLAIEAGCESLQRMRVELKSYVPRHNLDEQAELVRELFESYNLNGNFEQLQISEACSQVPQEGTRSSDDEVHSSLTTVGQKKLKPKSLNTDRALFSPARELNNSTATRIRGSWNKDVTITKPGFEIGDNKSVKKHQKPSKQESKEERRKIKKQGQKPNNGEDPVSLCREDDKLESNKENMMDAPQVEETRTGLGRHGTCAS